MLHSLLNLFITSLTSFSSLSLPLVINHEFLTDPCKDKICFYNSTCVKGDNNQGYCVCPQCTDRPVEYICASDGKTYPNECQARRSACITKTLLKTVHRGKCGKIHSVDALSIFLKFQLVLFFIISYFNSIFSSILDPCEDMICSFNAICVVNSNYKASCRCPKCPPSIKRVCGSDRKTYVNECELRKQSCTTKTNIRVVHQGKCSKFTKR